MSGVDGGDDGWIATSGGGAGPGGEEPRRKRRWTEKYAKRL